MSAELSMFMNPDSAPVEKWPDPLPLSGQVYLPEDYPLNALPPGIRAAVSDVQAVTQAPVAMVATSALTSLSVAAQGHIDMSRNAQLSGPVSLFALILAESGERKTTVDKFFTRSIHCYQATQAESSKVEVRQYQVAYQAWKAEISGIADAIKQASKNGRSTDELKRRMQVLNDEVPQAPKVPDLIYGDATPEALAFGLAKVWPSAAVISSEAGIVFGAHGMNSDSVMRNLAVLNVLWDGGEHKSSRRSVESYTVRGARLTVSLQAQLAVLSSFMGKAGDLARGSGFLARFLVAWPETTQGTRMYQEPNAKLRGLDAYDARLTQLLTSPLPFDETGNGLLPAMMSFSTEAKNVWISFYNLIERELAPVGEFADVRDVASKTADNASRIAALFCLFEDGADGIVSADHAEAACRIAMWHLSESRRLLTELAQDPTVSMSARLDAWIKKECMEQASNRISTRRARQYSPARGKEFDNAFSELVHAKRAHEILEGKSKWIVVNPKLISGEEKQ